MKTGCANGKKAERWLYIMVLQKAYDEIRHYMEIVEQHELTLHCGEYTLIKTIKTYREKCYHTYVYYKVTLVNGNVIAIEIK